MSRNALLRSCVSTVAVGAAALGLGLVAPTGHVGAGSPAAGQLRIDVTGVGAVRDDPCVDGRVGRCGFVLSGTLEGVPTDETFFIVIDDDGAATPDSCVPARYAGLLGDGADQNIGHVANGELCPDGAGGYVFAARFKITGGGGPFDGARGRGDVVANLGADGTATLAVTGTYRV